MVPWLFPGTAKDRFWSKNYGAPQGLEVSCRLLGSLSDDTIDLISLWIDEGANEEPNVDIEPDQEFPTAFTLHPNFPNPFNPTTTIRFSSEPNEETSLRVFDITGQVIEELFNGSLNAETHQIQWDAGHLPTGVYFAQLSRAGINQVIKMIYLK